MAPSEQPVASRLLAVHDTLQYGSTEAESAPFIGSGNIWVEDWYDDETMAFVRNAIAEAIENTAYGQLHVVGYDESISGLLAPFAVLARDEPKVIDILEDRQALESHISYLTHRAQAVQNSLKGSFPLKSYREKHNSPVEHYELIVLALDSIEQVSSFSSNLRKLFLNGPNVGMTFLVVAPLGNGFDKNPFFNTTFLHRAGFDEPEIHRGSRSSSRRIGRTGIPGSTPAEIAERCAVVQAAHKTPESSKTDRITVEFSQIHPGADAGDFARERWTRSSKDGLEFTIGTYAQEKQTILIGDELNQRHNVLITGAVGQGKSNLLSVIVHSLCWNYSYDELELYLLDFKEGVTFQSYANIGREEFLPHARAIGLESDVEFGIAVLEELFDEYQRRMRLFKRHDVRSLRELREARPETKLARIVVIIDEFQLMFSDERNARYVADLLEMSVRLFRAAGIHFILSSQTLEGNVQLAQRRDALFGQVPIRIALKNSLAESLRTLALDNPAAAYLQPREAIVNLDYGAVGRNDSATIAYANEGYLAALRRAWWRLGEDDDRQQPYVYDSARKARIDLPRVNRLRDAGGAEAAVGQRVSITGAQMTFDFPDEPGRNLAIIGAQDRGSRHAIGMMQSVALSLAARIGEKPARFIFFDFSAADDCWAAGSEKFAAAMEGLGHEVEVRGSAEFEDVLESLQAESDTPTFVFAAHLDNWAPTTSSFEANALVTFAERGPAHGLHFFGWWMRASNFQGHMKMGSDDPFNSKVLLRMSEPEIQRFVGAGATAVSKANRAIAIDKVDFTDHPAFVPFISLEDTASDFDAPATSR